MQRDYWVYMMASQKNGTLYIGMTNNIGRRAYQHKIKQSKGFTAKYNVNMLVWYEHCHDVHYAIMREKQLKRWERAWKIKLIVKMNPDWNDLYEDLNK
jgi:putative endonuclease